MVAQASWGVDWIASYRNRLTEGVLCTTWPGWFGRWILMDTGEVEIRWYGLYVGGRGEREREKKGKERKCAHKCRE